MSKDTNKELAEVNKKIKKVVASIKKDRDELRGLIGEYESILESVDDCLYNLEHAADSLSEYV